MSFREFTMTDVLEVLRRWQAGHSPRHLARRTAREGVADRKTATRYIQAALACGIERKTALDDNLIATVARRVQHREPTPPSEARKLLQQHRGRIEAWLAGPRPLRLARVH